MYKLFNSAIRRCFSVAVMALWAVVPAFAQLDDLASSVIVPEKVFTLKFGYAAVYYDVSDGYYLKMHTDSRKDDRDTYNVVYLGNTASTALASVDKMSEILAGDKLYTEARQKGTLVRFTREVNAVGYRQLAIRQDTNLGDSRLNKNQLTRLRSFFTQRAAEEEAQLMKLRRLQEEAKVKEEEAKAEAEKASQSSGGVEADKSNSILP